MDAPRGPFDGPVGLWADLGRLSSHLWPTSSSSSASRLKRSSKSRAAQTLLQFREPPEDPLDPVVPLSPWDELEAWAFQLQCRGHASTATQIQTLGRTLKSHQTQDAFLAPMVGLLCRLARPPPSPPPKVDPAPRPLALPDIERPFYDPEAAGSKVRPYAPISWGSGLESVTPSDMGGVDLAQLHAPPGTGLTFFGFSAHPAGLIPVPPLALTLDLQGRRRIRCPPPKKTRDPSIPDEGYHSPPPAENPSRVPPDLWSAIHEVELSAHRTWEALGTPNPAPEPPYLTEIGLESVHHVWRWTLTHWQCLDPKLVIPDLIVLPTTRLLRHIGYLMIGIESETFGYHEPTQSFHFWQPGTTVSGLSPEALLSAVQDLLVCGAFCRRLERFSELKAHPISSSSGSRHGGLVFEGFLKGIGQYLCGYRTTVLNIVRVKERFLDLLSALRPLAIQIHFLGRLCKLDQDQAALPVGIQLLCYLFDRTLHINTKDLYFVLVSLLKQSAHPYFRFLERWIFQGMCEDEFNEFGIVSNAPFLVSRNRIFWTNAHTVADLPLDASICGGGNFINDIQHQVYVCGKSMNLLKLCSPAHHLCSPLVSGQPSIQLLVTPIEVRNWCTPEHRARKRFW